MFQSKIKLGAILSLVMLITAACASANGAGSNSAGSGNAGQKTESAAVGSAASSSSDGDKVTISFYSYNLAIASQKEGTMQLIEEFEAAHPNIDVDPIAITSTEINTKVQADIAAGSSPDVAQIVFDGLDNAVNNFNAKALEDIVPEAELKQAFEGFSPNGLKLGQLNGQTYGLAFTFSTPVLFYNAKLFEEAGLDPDAPPTTWEEVKEYALQIASRTGNAGVHIGGSSGNDWIVQALIGSNGGSVLSDDRSTIKYGEPEAVGAIQMWQDLVTSGAHSKLIDSEVTQAFSEGKLGMLLYTSALQSAFIQAAEAGGWELKAAAMPAFGERTTTPVNSGSALMILSTDEAKQRAAWEFLKFVTSERGYTIITSKMGYLPLRPAIVDDPEYLKDWVADNPLVQPNLDQLNRLQPWVSYPGMNWYQIETTLLEAVQQSIQSTDDVTDIMQKAQQRAQSMMP